MIKVALNIEAEVEEVFNALTNPFTIELWSGHPAIMDDKEGTEFSLWGGDITGRNIKVVRNQELVQEWYFDELPEQSIATIKLFEDKKHTRVVVTHTNVPEDAKENIEEGWRDFYLGAIKTFFEVDID